CGRRVDLARGGQRGPHVGRTRLAGRERGEGRIVPVAERGDAVEHGDRLGQRGRRLRLLLELVQTLDEELQHRVQAPGRVDRLHRRRLQAEGGGGGEDFVAQGREFASRFGEGLDELIRRRGAGPRQRGGGRRAPRAQCGQPLGERRVLLEKLAGGLGGRYCRGGHRVARQSHDDAIFWP